MQPVQQVEDLATPGSAIPFLGTCAGFQHALLEFARTVCGIVDAAHAENSPDTGRVLVGPLACSLVGHEGRVDLAAGSLARQVVGAERSVERYHCTYGAVDPSYLDVLTAHGLRCSGHDEEGQLRVVELPDHPFLLATLFQPELAGDATRPHPVLRAWAAAAVTHAAGRVRPVG